MNNDNLPDSNEEKLNEFMKIVNSTDQLECEQFMKMAEYQIDTAVQLFFDFEGRKEQNKNLLLNSQNLNAVNHSDDITNVFQPPTHQNVMLIQQLQLLSSAELIRRYQLHCKENGIRQEDGIFKKLSGKISSICKNEIITHIKVQTKNKSPGEDFILHLSKQKIFIPLQFNLGTIQENLSQAYIEKLPLLLYTHIDQHQYYLKKFWENPLLVSYIKKNYRVLGVKHTNADLDCLKAILTDHDRNIPSILVIKRNLFDRIECMGLFNLSQHTNTEALLNQLQRIKTQFQQIMRYEEYIRRASTGEAPSYEVPTEHLLRINVPQPFLQKNDPQLQQQQLSLQQQQYEAQAILRRERKLQRMRERQEEEQQINSQFSQQNQLGQLQRLTPISDKLIEERRLRKEQEDALQQAEELQKLENAIRAKAKLEEVQREENKLQEKEELKLMKALRLSNLPTEPSEIELGCIQIYFRMPSGDEVQRRFYKSQQIQILFDYVGCLDLKYFEEELDQKFDLIQSFPKLELLGKEELSIESIFNDSQMELLIVKELYD